MSTEPTHNTPDDELDRLLALARWPEASGESLARLEQHWNALPRPALPPAEAVGIIRDAAPPGPPPVTIPGVMLKKRDDDLFQDTTMTFGEHLEELRGSLMKALVCLVIGTGLGLTVGSSVVDLITAPLKAALATYYKSESVEDYEKWAAERAKERLAVPYTVDEIKHLVDDQGQVFEIRYMHPKQVSHGLGTEAEAAPSGKRQRPAAGSGTDDPDDEQAKAPTLDASELVPIFLWQPVENDARINPTTLSAQEAFAIWFKASLVVGVIISSPLVFYFIWSFVAAGLYPQEKKHVYTFLPFSLGLFLAGAALSYLFVFQPVLDFLLRFNQQLDLDPDPRISEWLSFVLFLPLGFGISFQLPLVMLFLERLGIFNVRSYMEKWRIAVLVIFVLSAVLTPADPYSLLFMAVPLTILYFGGVLLCAWWPRKVSAAEYA